MSNNGYLISVINTIDDSKVHYRKSDNVLVIKKSEFNINNYYLIGKSTSKDAFYRYVNSFIKTNEEYIISTGFVTIEEVLVKLLNQHHLTISFAESCTGGLMASTIINISGASNIINESYVTYSNDSKMKLLGVEKATLDKYSVYSKETALEMAKGLYKISNSNVCVSITGLAGGTTYNQNDGSYDSCIIINYNGKEDIIEVSKHEKGLRNDVRKKRTNYVFYRIIKALKSIL